MIDLVTTMAARLNGNADYILYTVAALLTVVFWVVWIMRQRAAGRRGGTVPSQKSEREVSTGEPRPRVGVRSLVIVAYSFIAIGIVFILASLGRLKSHPATLYIGVGVVLVGWLIKMVAEYRFFANRRATRKP